LPVDGISAEDFFAPSTSSFAAEAQQMCTGDAMLRAR
jgi:hypothetical protein